MWRLGKTRRGALRLPVTSLRGSVTVIWDEDSSESRLSHHDVKPRGPSAAIPRPGRFVGAWALEGTTKGARISLADAGFLSFSVRNESGVARGILYERGDWLEAELWKEVGDGQEAFSTVVRLRHQEPGVLVLNFWVPEAEEAAPFHGRWIPAFASSGGQAEPVCGYWGETLTVYRVPGSEGPELMN